MTLGDFDNSPSVQDKQPCQFFVRIENLPWSASPRDVKAFFHGLDILPGGISIVGKNAFVSFERWEDMTSAMLRDGHTFFNQKLFLSIVDLKKVRKINDLHIQRSLYFLSLIGPQKKVIKDIDSEPLDHQRKIRPTALIGDTSDHKESNIAFVPEEIDSSTTGTLGPEMKPVYRRKRIKPTPLRKVNNWESSVLSPSPFQSDENWKKLIYH